MEAEDEEGAGPPEPQAVNMDLAGFSEIEVSWARGGVCGAVGVVMRLSLCAPGVGRAGRDCLLA